MSFGPFRVKTVIFDQNRVHRFNTGQTMSTRIKNEFHAVYSWSGVAWMYPTWSGIKSLKIFLILESCRLFLIKINILLAWKKYMKYMISTTVLWNTWKWFQQWFCEIHESDFNIGFLWNTWKWFQHLFSETHESDFRLALWNTWKWFQQWFCEIHESDFNIGFFFCEIHESDFNNVFVKYMKVISTMSFRVDEKF